MQRAGCSREAGQRLVGALVFCHVVEAPFMLLHGASAGDEAVQLAVHVTGLHLSAGPAQRAKVRARGRHIRRAALLRRLQRLVEARQAPCWRLVLILLLPDPAQSTTAQDVRSSLPLDSLC